MSNERFTHGSFWDHYSRHWDEEVRPHIEGELLGEEWTSPERTARVFEQFAAPYLDPTARVVEIGPGGGKFSRLLVERCCALTLVDISGEMLRRANEACGGRAREMHVEDGRLDGLSSESVDFVFSFDVFIHLESEEVFRYFVEVNRVLRPGGVFSIQTSTFESRWGFHSFLQQMRDNQVRIGERYGGRMYPLSEGILRRFAENSGFEVVDFYGGSQYKDVIFALRKVRPARAWRFVTTQEFMGRIELSDRVGGSHRRELYAAKDVAANARLLLVLGDADDPEMMATGQAAVPSHPGLAAPLGCEVRGGFCLVVHAFQAPLSLSNWRSTESPQPIPALAGRMAQVFQGLLVAHAAGLAHGELGADFVIWDEKEHTLKLLGLRQTEGAEQEALQRRDLAAGGAVLELIAPFLGEIPALPLLAKEMRGAPSVALWEKISSLLAARGE